MSPFAFAGRAVLAQTAAIAGGWDTRSWIQSHFGESPAFSSYVVSVEYMTVKKKREQKTHLELTNCEAHLPALSCFHSDTNGSVKFDGFLKRGVLLQEQQTLFWPADPNPATRWARACAQQGSINFDGERLSVLGIKLNALGKAAQ